MGIKCSFVGSKFYPSAYLRITHIGGNKEGGWNAQVRVFENFLDERYTDVFYVTVDYVPGEDPYKLVYQKLKTLEFIKNAVDFDTPIGEVEAIEPQKKSKKSKK